VDIRQRVLLQILIFEVVFMTVDFLTVDFFKLDEFHRFTFLNDQIYQLKNSFKKEVDEDD